MELPNYFLADLPDNSSLTPRLITEACQTLKQNREKFLGTVTTENLITILSRLARDWLDPEFLFRKMVLENGPEKTGFGRETLAAGLDRFFKQLTQQNLELLVLQDLGSLRRLDEMVADGHEAKEDRNSTVRGHELLAHITGGVLPNPSLTSVVLGFLTKSAQFVKCATGTSYIPRMFAHSLYAVQPKLGACLEIAEWKGGTIELETALFTEAGCVTATGSDESLGEIRRRLPGTVRFLGYGHKLSVAYVTRESLDRSAANVAAAIAEDVVAWNQLGCLSPHAVYVESGGAVDSAAFAGLVAKELEKRDKSEPRGKVPPEVAASISTRRMYYEVRASADPTTKVWSSNGSSAWTVVHEESPDIQPSCLNRFIHVKTTDGLDPVLAAIRALPEKISTVGLAAPMARAKGIASRLAGACVSRVCRVGSMQNPPITWRHDGRPSLADLVTWTDLEF